MKTWGCVAVVWAAVLLELGWRDMAGVGYIGLAALAVAPMAMWVMARSRRGDAKGIRAIDAEGLAWEQLGSDANR